MVGRCVSFWEGLFSGAMLVSGRVGSLFSTCESRYLVLWAFESPFPPAWSRFECWARKKSPIEWVEPHQWHQMFCFRTEAFLNVALKHHPFCPRFLDISSFSCQILAWNLGFAKSIPNDYSYWGLRIRGRRSQCNRHVGWHRIEW